MINNSSTPPTPPAAEADDTTANSVKPEIQKTKTSWSNLLENLVRMGLGEPAIRFGAGLVSLLLVLIVIWVMGNFYLKGSLAPSSSFAQAASLPTTTPLAEIPPFDLSNPVSYLGGITRLAQIHTTLPTHPRYDVVQYTIQKGDTIFGIAKKYNLKPQTILWGNQSIIGDNPENISPGVKINILPVDGLYYKWNAGDGLNGVAKFFGVQTDDIINWPGNHLNKDTLGDLSNPKIPADTWLVIPGGTREFVSWSAPQITRKNPAVAKLYGPGACGPVPDGAIGTGNFVWPTTEHFISGYDYTPEVNHFGIDIAGQLGNNIFAIDGGVVVYSGWNDWGYGNVVVIDHGNGWQSLYAHMSEIYAKCGASVLQGAVIGAMGSTGHSSGPHLHFEMSDNGGHINPWTIYPK